MPAEQAKVTDRPPELLTEDSVEALLQSMPNRPATIQKSLDENPSFVLDSIAASEPEDSVIFTWFVRIVVGAGLAVAAGVAIWLTLSSIHAFLR